MSMKAQAARDLEHQRLGVASIVFMVLAAVAPLGAVAVSYTHLTLPTKA